MYELFYHIILMVILAVGYANTRENDLAYSEGYQLDVLSQYYDVKDLKLQHYKPRWTKEL